jgi:hypothetical protein
LGIGKLREVLGEVLAMMAGPPKVPTGLRVSTTRQGLTGTKWVGGETTEREETRKAKGSGRRLKGIIPAGNGWFVVGSIKGNPNCEKSPTLSAAVET